MMNSTTTRTLAASVLAATLGLAQAGARNVDVSTLPDRDTVQLTIYNAEDLTLVRETRRITFRKGMNPLQFSWANTLIDPTSVDIRFKSHATKLDVLDTTFPHDKPQMLYWNVRSSFDGEAVVEISYFTSGITWSEDYAGAQVRLVVGEINLVEKIADLARRGLISNKERDAYLNGRRRGQAFEQEEARTEFFRAAGKVMSAPSEPKQIVKQGLSEYFIFTIPGQETVPNGWSKRMRLFEGQQVPFEIVYRYRPAEYGEQLVRLFSLRNDEKSKLGSTPLPNGIVRLFRDNGRDGLSFLTAYQTKYVPIGQEIELNLGRDPEVIHERIRLRAWRDNFWFRGRKPKLYFSPTKGHRIEPNYSVAGWDDNETWVERIRNYRDKPIQVEIRRSYGGHVIFASDLGTTLYDYRSPQFTARIAAAEERDLSYDLTVKQGINKKQDNVTLE
jgi:hypothetical protein